MSRQYALYLLLATTALIGILFYQVIEPFVVSLLFAAVLAVLFRPSYQWIADRLGGHRHLAATAMTLAVLLLILLPTVGTLVLAGVQMTDLAGDVMSLLQEGEKSDLEDELEQFEQSRLAKIFNDFYRDLSADHRQHVNKFFRQAGDGVVKQVYENTASIVQDLFRLIVGTLVTGFALYYFLALGDSMLQQAKDFLPLSKHEQETLFSQFGTVCRAVVLGTVVAALVQALLAGVGFLVAGVPNVILLMTTAMFFAFIPFFGASSVVIAVAAWLALEGRYLAAGFLFLYCVLLISTSDNLIRAYVIGSEAKLNPLVAFISVLGAIQLIGLLGIFVGPMIAAFFYTLLKLLRERIVKEELE